MDPAILIFCLRQETGAAEDGPPLGRVKRHRCFCRAYIAYDGYFDFSLSSGLSIHDSVNPFVFGLLANFAALRRVFETFVPEELLLSGGPDKIFATIHAANLLIGKNLPFSSLGLLDRQTFM